LINALSVCAHKLQLLRVFSKTYVFSFNERKRTFLRPRTANFRISYSPSKSLAQ